MLLGYAHGYFFLFLMERFVHTCTPDNQVLLPFGRMYAWIICSLFLWNTKKSSSCSLMSALGVLKRYAVKQMCCFTIHVVLHDCVLGRAVNTQIWNISWSTSLYREMWCVKFQECLICSNKEGGTEASKKVEMFESARGTSDQWYV